MEKSFTFTRDVCGKCAGRCCHEGLYVTTKEYETLSREHRDRFRCEKFMNGYRAIGGRCSFLSDRGCVIPAACGGGSEKSSQQEQPPENSVQVAADVVRSDATSPVAEPPDFLSMKDEDGRDASDFCFRHETAYSGKRVMTLYDPGNGGNLFEYNGLNGDGDTKRLERALLFEKETGEQPLPEPRVKSVFYAVYWHSDPDAAGNLWIWLDAVTDVSGDGGMVPGRFYAIQTDQQRHVVAIRSIESSTVDPALESAFEAMAIKALGVQHDGMKALLSGERIILEGRHCLVVAFGTDLDGHFSPKRRYAVELYDASPGYGYWKYDNANGEWEYEYEY